MDIRKDLDEILMKMKKGARKNIKKGLRKGIKVRVGGKNDLEVFYDLMGKTCQRKQVAPNPSDIAFFEIIWQAFEKENDIRIFMACHEGMDISGQLALIFGDVVYFWKSGWSGEYGSHKPNDVLYWAVIKWAKANGYAYIDLVTISPDVSAQIKAQKKLSEDLKDTESSYKLNFGGDLIYFPEASVYFQNPFIRWAYKLTIKFDIGRRLIKNYV